MSYSLNQLYWSQMSRLRNKIRERLSDWTLKNLIKKD